MDENLNQLNCLAAFCTVRFIKSSISMITTTTIITLQATSEQPCQPFGVRFIESSSLNRKVRALSVGLFAFPHIDLTWATMSHRE